ncbi:MAG: SDR family NAD(P)-dependent oxidoreductase [Dehalococcoidia bacterium]|nr:SDR family NAD(P)-dependent oxidoreductase [Dehalococcoidia bacterium]
MRLENKVALITGSTSGIGEATANAFAREGARVIIVGRNQEAAACVASAVKAAGSEAFFIKADVSDSSQVQAMAKSAINHWGRIDVLVNNAGGARGGRGSVTEVSEAGWSQVIETNLKSIYLVTREVLPSMIEKGGGAIVNTASVYGLVGARNQAAYSASKGAVVALTRQLAVDYADNHIRVNCVCPGAIMTPLIQDYINSTENPEQARAFLGDRCPQLRIGRPEEVANAILFLASDESSYITGVALPVDGGLSAA